MNNVYDNMTSAEREYYDVCPGCNLLVHINDDAHYNHCLDADEDYSDE